MDSLDITNTVLHKFADSVKADKKITAILEKVKKGTATQRDIADYADLLGQHASDALDGYVDYKNFSETKEAIQRLLKSNYLSVNGQAILQLRSEDLKKGLDIVIREADDFRTDAFVGKLSNLTENQFNQEMTEGVKTTTRQYYDDFQKTNAALREELGYDEAIVRIYDDVGLRDGTQVCQFCKSLEGTYDYKTAKQEGAFRRHEGCGCHIELITPSGIKTQTQWYKTKDTKGNQWTDNG